MAKSKTKKFQPSSKLLSPLRLVNFTLCFAIVGVLAVVISMAGPIPGMYGSVEKDQANRINVARSRVGASQLQHIECLNTVAENWTKKLVADNALSHSRVGDEVTKYCGSGWASLGENVGYGGSSEAVFNAFMASPGHKENILRSKYTKMGVGAYWAPNGRLFVTQVFAVFGEYNSNANVDAILPADPKAPEPTKYQGVIGLKADYDGDGKSDIFWYNAGTGADNLSYGTGTDGKFVTIPQSVDRYYKPVAGDFNGDGKSDIFWYGPGTAADAIWYGTGTRGTFTQVAFNEPGAGYVPIPGDFNGDSYDDIFLYAPGTAADYILYGTASKGSLALNRLNSPVNSLYAPIPGDFNGDGLGDIFFYAPGSVQDYAWYGTTTRGSFTSVGQNVAGTTYRPAPGDYDGDGVDDIYWYAPGADVENIWHGTRQKGVFARTSAPSTSGTYESVPGDFNGDGKGDVLFYARGTANDYIHYGTATRGNFRSSTLTAPINGEYEPIPQ